MKFLIAGFGSIGRRHFYNLKALGEKDILFYRSGQSQLPTEDLAGYPVEHDLDAALAHRPDAVIVANPTAFHLDVAIPAAQSGCHLLLEKPISHNLDRVEELDTAVNNSGCRVLVGFQFRFHPGLQKIVEILSSGELGRPYSARAHWGEYLPEWHPWENYRRGYSARTDLGGGVLLTLCHPFDYLRWLLGEINEVWAFTSRSGELKIEVEDQAEVGLEFDGGTMASVHLDYLQRPAAHWLEILCMSGALHWDAGSHVLRVLRGKDGSELEIPAPVAFDRNDLFLAEMRHFIDVVSGRAEPQCTLEDGHRALEIALAAYRSSAEGEKVELAR